MIPLTSLVIPIVVSAVFVFVVSSILHMVLTYHRKDYKALPNEEASIAGLRGVAPGYYVFPHCQSSKEMASDEMKAKYAKGPIGMLVVRPTGQPGLGSFLGLWFVYCLIVSLFVAYLAGRTLAHGADYLAVFRFAGTAAFLAYGVANFADSVWKGMPWSNTVRATIDGLIYALMTGGTFGWLWPR